MDSATGARVLSRRKGPFIITADALLSDSGIAEPSFPHAFEHTVESLARRDIGVFAAQPVLRDRTLGADRMEHVRQHDAGLGTAYKPLRLRARSHRLRLSVRRPTKTAWEVYNERRGVCRDYAHLAIALCRA
jgi:hypothetical protein